MPVFFCTHCVYIVQTVTGVEVTIGNCFPDVGAILPEVRSIDKII